MIRKSKHSMTIVNLFQILTGCGLFFACMRISPLAAILLTIVSTPAIIRTGLISQRFRDKKIAFGLRDRFQAFGASLGVTLVTMLTSFMVFLIVSVAFGFLCMGIMMMTLSAHDLLADIGFIGTLGGTIWGAAAAMLSLTWTQRLWRLPTA